MKSSRLETFIAVTLGYTMRFCLLGCVCRHNSIAKLSSRCIFIYLDESGIIHNSKVRSNPFLLNQVDVVPCHYWHSGVKSSLCTLIYLVEF